MTETVSGQGGSSVRAATTENALSPTVWNALPHFLPLGIFPLIVAAAIYGGWWLLPPFVFFMLAGPLDIALGVEERNMDPLETPESRLVWHNLPVWLWAFLWPVTLVFGLWQVLVAGHLAVWEAALVAIILANEAQAVFIVGHELIHRRTLWERRLGEFLLASASYPQYATEHVYIHHALVGTPMDVGSAPKGQSFWHYFPREVASNFTGSWRVVRERLARRRLPVWHYTNPFWRYGVETAFWYALIYWMGGLWAVLAFVLLCLGVVMSMKISNYLQHYGLRRIRRPNGRFEKVQPRHSWSASCRFSNWMFYNMQRHPDHHAVASRHYPLLQHYGEDGSPQLPGSYAKMFALAVRPRRWFETMDPLVDEWRARFYPEIEDWSAYDSPVSAARPEAFGAIEEIFGAAPRLAEWIARHPELLDSLQDREFTDLDLPKGFGPDPQSEAIARRGLARLYWTREFGVAEMRERIAEIPFQGVEDAVETVRNWTNDKAFQICMHTLRGNLSPVEAGTALSHLAEAATGAVLSAVEEDFASRFVRGGVAAVLLGDLASRDAAPGVRIQVLLLHEGAPRDHFESLCRRLLRALRSLSRDSVLFAPTLSGEDAGAFMSFDDFAAGKRLGGQEGLELVRARPVFVSGGTDLGTRFEAARREILARETPVEAVQDDNGSEPAPGLSSIADKRGGLRDVEHAARAVQSAHAQDTPELLDLDAASVFRTAGTKGLVPPDIAGRLEAAAGMWRSVQGALQLVGGDGFDVGAASSRVRAVVARCCGKDDFDELAAAIGETASGAANDLDALDFGAQGR